MSREVPTVLQAIAKYEGRECSKEGNSWRITLNSIVFDRSLYSANMSFTCTV